MRAASPVSALRARFRFLALVALHGVAIVARRSRRFSTSTSRPWREPVTPCRKTHSEPSGMRGSIESPTICATNMSVLRRKSSGASTQPSVRNLLVLEKLSGGRPQRIARQMRAKLQHVALDVLQIQPIQRAPEILHHDLFAIRHPNARPRDWIPDIRTVSPRPSPAPFAPDRPPRACSTSRSSSSANATIPDPGGSAVASESVSGSCKQNAQVHQPLPRRLGLHDGILAQPGLRSPSQRFNKLIGQSANRVLSARTPRAIREPRIIGRANG